MSCRLQGTAPLLRYTNSTDLAYGHEVKMVWIGLLPIIPFASRWVPAVVSGSDGPGMTYGDSAKQPFGKLGHTA